MPEHVHLLASELRNGALASAIRSLKQSVAQRQKRKPFWYPRYYDFNIFSHAKFIEKLDYMRLNPVKRGLCERPDDWRWSSATTHLIGFAAEGGAPTLTSTETLSRKT